ncbi:alkaline phosphatase family protein [Actinacidiphila glaucinigra]|uniref:sulfatase n=1 Tax=Actinacidiphila glaucinigra TaxID=235986 RepID=UPI00367216D9
MSLFIRSDRPGTTDDGPPADGSSADGGGAPGDGAAAHTGWRDRRPAAARALRRVTTALAAVVVLAALVVPDRLSAMGPDHFVRLPVEGLLGTALLIALPRRARRPAAVLIGLGLGVLVLLKCLDMGFYEVFARRFDPVFDWSLLADGEGYLTATSGRAYAVAATTGVVLLVLLVPALTVLSTVRLSRLVDRHGRGATRATLALGTVWVLCAALGLETADAPVASRESSAFVQERAGDVRASLRDREHFAEAAAHDAFAGTPGDRMLTALRGKDVIFAFVESYGRSAVEDPRIAPGVDAALADGTRTLRAAGFSSRSGWLTSPTYGGGSWLAHSTFLSGLWVPNQQRYRSVVTSDRLTLTDAFRRTGAWRTVGIMPGVTASWPEGGFYGLDHVYDSRDLGYRGPKFSWAPVPDQYSLSAFQRLEHGRPHDKPLMTEIILVSSHRPWAPVPEMIDWDRVGDGSVYDGISKRGKNPDEVWKDRSSIRTEYGNSIRYSVNSLVQYVAKYGTKDTVLVFLGDHQPSPVVTGSDATSDVPVAIVAHDQAVLDRTDGWGWSDGLQPAHDAPVWRMDTFRDRFLTAYGSRPAP